MVEDGRTLGAMKGCVKLFPVSRIAMEELRLREKLEKYQKSYGAQARLNRHDEDALKAIEAFYDGTRNERSALFVVEAAKRANQARYRR